MIDKEANSLLIFSLLFDFILEKLSINIYIFWIYNFLKCMIINSDISFLKKVYEDQARAIMMILNIY